MTVPGPRLLPMLALLACAACAGGHKPRQSDGGTQLPDAGPPTGTAGGRAPTTPPGAAGSGTAGSGTAGSDTAGTVGMQPTTPPPSGPPVFPLEVSPNGRFLVDTDGKPFLISQASSWGLIQALSTADATTYLDNLKQRGFNTVMVSIISNDTRSAGGPPNWQGVSPFTRRWDFSTWNEEYFEHADEIIRLAGERDMLVTLVPSYLGFPQDSSQGWADELMNANNDEDTSRSYGEFLGDRYKNVPNIVWIAGGDNQPKAGSPLEARLLAIVQGIQSRDKVHLWTAHWDGQGDGALATDNKAFAALMDVNGYYAYNYDLTYQRDLEAYAMSPPLPLFHLDMSYETEGGGTPDNIRRKAYGVMLSGGAGSSFNAGPDWYLFFKWRNMDTQGTRETTYWARLFRSRAWYELIPDKDHKVVTSGYGSFGNVNYVTAARSASGKLVMAYLPAGAAVSVDFGMLSGAKAQIWWYDPTTGKATSGGTQATEGTQRLTPPARKSYALVIDDAALGLLAPGSE